MAGREITWVVNSSLRGLLDGHPELDRVIAFDRGRARRASGLAMVARFLASLRRERFDLTIDLQGLLRSGLMTLATGARVRVGLADAREGATRFYTHRIPSPGPETHAVDRLLHVAEAWGPRSRSRGSSWRSARPIDSGLAGPWPRSPALHWS